MSEKKEIETPLNKEAKALFNKRDRAKVSDPRHLNALAMWLDGKSQKDISVVMGVHQSCISKWFSRPEIAELRTKILERAQLQVEDKVRANWAKHVARIEDISINSEDEKNSIAAFRELRILTGRGVEKHSVQTTNISLNIANFLDINNVDDGPEPTDYEIVDDNDDDE